MEDQTTIVGRPTFMAMFPGTQEAGPILDKLTALGYPRADITILLRPPGTDSALDLLTDTNAAGQDTNVRQMLTKNKEKLQQATTLLILHPAADRLDAVRAAVRDLGGEEFDYEPRTVYSGEASEEDFALATVDSADVPDNAGLEGHATIGPDEATSPGHFHPSPARATGEGANTPAGRAAASATDDGKSQSKTESQRGSGAPSGSGSPGKATAPAVPAEAQPAGAETDDIKHKIAEVAGQVEDIRHELEGHDPQQ